MLLSAPDSAVEAAVAERFALRLRGLAGLEAGALVPLLFPRCRSVHTLGMRAAIDVVWLELESDGLGTGNGEVMGVHASLGPRRWARAPRVADSRGRVAALELPAGVAVRSGLIAHAPIELLSID